MKRKITELEQKLIKKGLKLEKKVYSKKDNKKVAKYIYGGVIELEKIHCLVQPEVELDPKREKILDIRVCSYILYINKDMIREITEEYNELTSFILGEDDEIKA